MRGSNMWNVEHGGIKLLCSRALSVQAGSAVTGTVGYKSGLKAQDLEGQKHAQRVKEEEWPGSDIPS